MGSPNPNVAWISSVRSNTARISSTNWSGVQMMCESSWVPAADAQQPVQRAQALVAVDRAQLRQPHRQVAIRAHLRLVDQDVERAVHRLHVVVAGVRLHRRIHVVRVLREVPGGLPQHATARCAASRPGRTRAPGAGRGRSPRAACGRCRRADARPTAPARAPRGTRTGRAAARAGGGRASRPPRGGQVRVEVVLGRPRRAVDPGELGRLLVAPPVRAGDVRQAERAEPAGGGNVRPEAEVDPTPLR